jgi:hypothetical protein
MISTTNINNKESNQYETMESKSLNQKRGLPRNDGVCEQHARGKKNRSQNVELF